MSGNFSRTWLEDIWTPGSAINDGLTPTDHDGNAVHGLDTVNFMCSQIADILGEAAWETAPDASIATMWAKKWLDDVAGYRLRLILPTVEITVPSAVYATGSITTVAKANLADGEGFVIDDGENTATEFEFDVSGTYTPSGSEVEIDVSALTTADDIRDAIITAIDGVGITLRVDASNGGAATVDLTNDFAGTFANIAVTEDVTDAGFVVAGMTGGVGDRVTLSDANNQTPATVKSLDGGALEGSIAKVTASWGSFTLDEVAGDNALNPANLIRVTQITTDDDSGDPIKSEGRMVYGLLQAETSAGDGTAWTDTTPERAQISFVRVNEAQNDLERCPAGDIAGKTIRISYQDLKILKDWTKSDWLPHSLHVDVAEPAVDHSLDIAYNGGSQVAVDDSNVDWRVTDTKKYQVSDSGGSEIFLIEALSGGDKITMNVPGTLDLNGDLDGGANKATFNSLAIGDNVGEVTSVGANDLDLVSAQQVTFTTVRESAIPLDDGTAGAISALFSQSFASVSAAIKYAGEHGGVDLTHTWFVVSGGPYAEGANIANAAGMDLGTAGANIDMNGSAYFIFILLNGVQVIAGNASTNNAVIAGTTPANGDLKFYTGRPIRNGDIIQAMKYAQ